MDHPNIAKALDAGASSDGRPYFVMEYIDGEIITDYCDRHQLSVTERLGLFMQVCQAIQHAHQKSVIHCDIKPSNVLVAVIDGKPVPKVIDFGIAQATIHLPLADKTLVTSLRMLAATPSYMSPEQAAGSRDIDTRSDIYSLGVLLYELLAGQPAFNKEELSKAADDEVLRIVREKDPPRPSARLTTLGLDKLALAARNRRIEPHKLSKLIRGDLDWIVMRALEKDRARRYATVSGLAQEIQRFLNHEPVESRSPSRLYRFQKVVRRNRLVFAAAGAVFGALVAGLGLSTWLFLREQAVSRRAQAAEAKAEKHALQYGTVLQLAPRLVEKGGTLIAKGDKENLLSVLGLISESIRTDLTNQPDAAADYLSSLGGDYMTLGDYDDAEKMHQAALDFRTKLSPKSLKVTDSLNDLANAYYRNGKLTNAESTHLKALGIRTNLFGSTHPKVGESLDNLANVIRDEGRLKEAEAIQRKSLAMWMELRGANSDDTALCLGNLAGTLSLEGRLREGELMQRHALEITRRILGSDTRAVAIDLNDLADMMLADGNLREAEATNRVALALRLKLFGD